MDIDAFMNHYRSQFPSSRVTPKLHMLEDNVIPGIQHWNVGLGFHGEQGAESIHAIFNSLNRTYSNIRNHADRLKGVMREHYLQIAPSNVAKTPAVKKRKINIMLNPWPDLNVTFILPSTSLTADVDKLCPTNHPPACLAKA